MKKIIMSSIFSKILMVIAAVSVVDLMIYDYHRKAGYTHLQAMAETLQKGIIIGIAAIVLIVFLVFKNNK